MLKPREQLISEKVRYEKKNISNLYPIFGISLLIFLITASINVCAEQDIPTNCTITSDFENGNIGNIIENPLDTFTMEFGPGAGGIWFHIKLSGCNNKDLKFILKMTRDLNTSAAHWYDGERKNTPVVTHDNINWEKIYSSNLDKSANTFTFTYTPGYNIEWIAYFYPFTNWQLDEFLQIYSSNPFLKSEIIGTTPMGHEQKMMTITDPNSPDEEKKVVWIISREDAWETAGTFNTIGEIKYLLSNDKLAVNLRKNVIFKFVPIVSVDGVSKGTITGIQNGNPAQIYSLTTSWMENPSPKEIENIKNQIRKWKNSGNKIDLIGRHHSYGFMNELSLFGPSNMKLKNSAMKNLQGTTIGSEAKIDSRFPDFVLTLYPEVAYFDSEMTAVGKTIPDTESFGVDTIKTIADYFGITPAPNVISTPLNSTHPNMFLNQNEITKIKDKLESNQQPWESAYNIMALDNSMWLNMPVQSVMFGGKMPPSLDKHDYFTEPPYSSDGVSNPDADRTDYNALIQTSRAVKHLGIAYALTGNNAYADKAIELLNVWTVNSSTRMNPKFTNGQSRIELSVTTPGIFYGADLIWNYPGWKQSDKDIFKEWTIQMITNAKTWSDYNNFENWRLVFISSASVIAEDVDSRQYAFDRWKAIIPEQINTDGSMKYELSRTNSLSYSTYALNAMIQTAEIARHNNVDLYNYTLVDGRGLEKALDFHVPYIVKSSIWPYEQISVYKGDNSAIYELAYSFKQKSSYSEVINKWGGTPRNMDEIRVMGPTTLTHATSSLNGTLIGILLDIKFINGTVYLKGTNDGIPGVTVSSSTLINTTTNETGFYSLALDQGIYDITARLDPTYYPNSSLAVSTDVIYDIALDKKPVGNITGSVTIG